MNQEMEFKNIVAQYSKVKPEEMTGEMRFREDLGFTSLDFMSFLGELEDTFDIELEETEVTQITTLEERDFHQKRTSCRRLCGKAYCIDRNQLCRMDRKLSGNYYRMYYSGAAGCSTPM